MSEAILKCFKVRGRIPGRDREGEIESLLGNAVLMHWLLISVTAKLLIFQVKMRRQTSFQSNQMSATIVKGTKVKRIVFVRDREGEMERLLDTAIVMHCYSTARTTKMLIFLAKMLKNNISAKPNVGNHCEGLQSKEENTGKRQRGRDIECARHCACDALLFHRLNKENVDFSS